MKLSKYTIYVKDDSENIILYNSLRGIESICKLKYPYSQNFISYLNQLEELEPGLEKYLISKKYLIENYVDENARLRFLYLKEITNNILNLIILPTEKCNFRCKYCYESFSVGKMNSGIQQKIIDFVKKKINKYNGLHVMWFGGEPLLVKDIIYNMSNQFIDICNKNHKLYIAQMTTNGYELTPAIFDKLYKCGVIEYQITLDGPSMLHDLNRVLPNGRGTFKVIFENLMEIKKRYSNRRFEMVIRTNLTKQIIDYINEYIDMCNNITENDNRFKIDIQFVSNWLEKSDDSMRKEMVSNDDVRLLFKKLYASKMNLNNLYIGDLQPGGAVCPNGRLNSLVFRPNGEIHKCTMSFENKDTMVGNMFEERMINEDRYSDWLCKFDHCGKISECKFAPICFGDTCAAQRILMPEQEYSCPRIANYSEMYLLLLNKSGYITNTFG